MNQPKTSPLIFILSFVFLFEISPQAQNSVLSSGNWHKIAVNHTGIHKITYDDLENYGILVSQINPKNIRIYGNGNGMLPEMSNEFRYDDLQQNAIYVHGEADGVFDHDDYILFYGEGPIEWRWNQQTGHFEHALHLYDVQICYFLTTDLGEGKRIESQPSLPVNPTYVSNSFDDFAAHELDLNSLIQSGREWYGEEFGDVKMYDFSMDFPNLIVTEPVVLTANVASRSIETGTFDVAINGSLISSITVPLIHFSAEGLYARDIAETNTFLVDGPLLNISFSYSSPYENAIGWLDYFAVNVKRALKFDSGQMQFRDKESVDTSMITTFQVTTSNSDFNIWNITDPLNPLFVDFDQANDTASFTLPTDSLLSFVIFDQSQFFAPEYIGEVVNQNLHAIAASDMLIISLPDFIPQAQQLADFRETHNGLSCYITTPEKIYNEFSSGVQDVTAIRDFVNYLYNKSDHEKPEFLLMFGDASFDYRNLSGINTTTQLVPTWESPESLHQVNSYCSDDFFVTVIDSDFGTMLNSGIGRLPVKTPQEAAAVVEKIIFYESSPTSFGNWRTKIVSIADDENMNVHLNHAEAINHMIDTTEASFNISKIYLDAFIQDTLPNGNQGYTQVNREITNKINSGVNVINYTGHGYYNALAHEKILTEDDLINWDNQTVFPFLYAASCSVGRFDNPEKYSISEQAVLMEGKGMSAIISATRLTFGSSNHTLQKTFYSHLLNNPESPLGIAFSMAKNSSAGGVNSAKYVLLGDPAMRLAIPEYRVVTEAINGTPVTIPPDTLQPGGQVTVTGYLTDREGNQIYDFNGAMDISIYDKARVDSTLGNDPHSYVVGFVTQDSVLAIKETEVVNGRFSAIFNLPVKMDESYGKIKLSYYAHNQITDAMGYYSELIVGGPSSAVTEIGETKEFITFFPTVVTSQLHFTTGQHVEQVNIEIFNLSGNLVSTTSRHLLSPGESGMIEVAKLPKGMYIIRARTNRQMNNFKIIKQ
jgi:hypothetical protein